MEEQSSQPTSFDDLSLNEQVLRALKEVGYESPSPIQAAIIPYVLEGRDVIGQAQTGTGKTAAFALPLLSRIDLEKTKKPQALILTPTRELAIQVAEAVHKYGSYLDGFRVVPIYGGQDFVPQLKQLKRGAHVIVGTPGRVMDHMRRETLDLSELRCLILDEADEMLRMGFIDDVDWIMEQTPDDRQVALFSATMPNQIRRIAQRHLNDPKEIVIEAKMKTAEKIRQRYWMVSGLHKLDALTRILETEEFDAMIVFVRTKSSAEQLAARLDARGFSSAPLNGDIPQAKRERTIEGLKAGKFDILVATDVAARGLDVDRISHVINFDIPYDTEAYVHRIGRTGRAGREGDAILFVAPREKRLLYSIEKATKRKIELMRMPSVKVINDKRVDKFKETITEVLEKEDLTLYRDILEQYRLEKNIPSLEVAAALAKMLQGETPLLMSEKLQKERLDGLELSQPGRDRGDRSGGRDDRRGDRRGDRGDRGDRRGDRGDRGDRRGDRPQRDRGDRGPRRETELEPLKAGMERFRVEVGRVDNVKPGSIVGAIANEAGLDGQHIGRIAIFEDHCVVDLPEGMPKEIMKVLKKCWVSGKQLSISRFKEPKGR